MRLTWVTDHLGHVLEHSQGDETSGTWTGLACPGHGLAIGSDADNATLLRLAGQCHIADLIWEASAEFTAEHGQVAMAALQAHLSGSAGEGEQLWQQLAALWTRAWSYNCQVLELRLKSGLTRFSPAGPACLGVTAVGAGRSQAGDR